MTTRHGAALRLAFVGCGAIAEWHLRAVRAAATRTTITTLVDVDESRAQAMAADTGGVAFTSVEDALEADSFDAALVMLPHHLHERVAVALLDAEKHLLLEKPMAPTLEECERILDAARRAESVFMVAENAQYWPEIVLAQDLVESGVIGEIVTARAWHAAQPMESFYPDADAWRFSSTQAGGGVAMDAGSHWLRPLRMWLGEVREVVATTARPLAAMEAESLCRALCRFESGVVASFDVLLSPGPVAPLPLFEVIGDRGEIVIDGIGRVKLYDGSDARGTVVGQGNYLLSYEGQIAAFERAVLDGIAPPVDAAHSLGELRAALAMYRSAASGRWEPVW